jgi:hypothetical protein
MGGDAFDALYRNTMIHHASVYNAIVGDIVRHMDQRNTARWRSKIGMNMGLDQPAFLNKRKPEVWDNLNLGHHAAWPESRSIW